MSQNFLKRYLKYQGLLGLFRHYPEKSPWDRYPQFTAAEGMVTEPRAKGVFRGTLGVGGCTGDNEPVVPIGR